jgi:hypothetical protein
MLGKWLTEKGNATRINIGDYMKVEDSNYQGG